MPQELPAAGPIPTGTPAPTILVISLLLLMSDAAAADSTAELDPKSLVVPASALGPEWSGSQLPVNMSIVDETNGFYGVMYQNGVAVEPRAAMFMLDVTPDRVSAAAFIAAVRQEFVAEGQTSTPWSGLGDGDSYHVRVVQ